ncbi:hypothetical protein, partial [Mesorhizobium intechi]|uniref:hypothetical protein n=1 Tax=Mesorhizobium intechi TaxID=537601 RepID=UPI001ABFA897
RLGNVAKMAQNGLAAASAKRRLAWQSPDAHTAQCRQTRKSLHGPKAAVEIWRRSTKIMRPRHERRY